MTQATSFGILSARVARSLAIFVSLFGFYTGIVHGASEDPLDVLKSGDVATAAKLLGELAEDGDKDAQYALGVIHYRGDLGVVDNEEATRWFRKAAEQNHLEAMFNLGIAYWEGRGVEQDFGESYRWWRRAAELDYPPAQHNLATVYYMGKGAEKDLPLAVAWFKRAAENGHNESRQILDTLQGGVTPEPAAEPAAGEEAVAALSGPTAAAPETPDSGAERPGEAVTVVAFPSATAPEIGEFTWTLAPREVARENDWVQVVVPEGALVWIYGSFLDVGADSHLGVVNGTGVRMRPSPDTGPKSPPVGVFSLGETVEVIEERGEWTRVRVAVPVAGWVRAGVFENL